MLEECEIKFSHELINEISKYMNFNSTNQMLNDIGCGAILIKDISNVIQSKKFKNSRHVLG